MRYIFLLGDRGRQSHIDLCTINDSRTPTFTPNVRLWVGGAKYTPPSHHSLWRDDVERPVRLRSKCFWT